MRTLRAVTRQSSRVVQGLILAVVLATSGLMPLLTAGSASADTVVYTGTGASDWNTAGGYGTATDNGDGTATLEGAGSDNTGPYTWFGAGDGGRTTWTGDWKTDTPVYLDPSWADGSGFDYSVAANNASGSFLRDFVFHVGEENGQLEVSASNNSSDSAVAASEFSNGYTPVTTAGWYTLEQEFTNVGGQLVVDFNLINSAGQSTLVNALSTDPIASVSGNSYGWFTFITVPGGLQVGTVSYSSLTAATVTDGSGTILGYYDTIAAAANAAVSGDTIQVVPGAYTENGITLSQPNVTLEGNGATLNVPDGASSNGITIDANGDTVTGLNIQGPANQSYTTYNWGSNISRGVVVSRGVSNFAVTDNTIANLRNNILVDGRGDTGSITGNVIDNSKSGISVQYTDATGLNISGNTQGQYGNDWGVNLHLNGYVADPTDANAQPVSNPALGAADAAAQAVITNLSAANDGWPVLDQTYTSNNRTAATVNASGTPTAQGDPLGPISDLQTAVNDVISGGTVNLASDVSVASQVTITKPITLNGNGYTVSAPFAKTSNANNAAIGITSTSGVTINGLTEDGTGSTDLHGFNVFQSSNVVLNNVTAQNNGHDGVVVNASTVTVSGFASSHNGWAGIDVDKGTGALPATLTVSGTSTQSENALTDPAILVDNPSSYNTVTGATGQYQQLAAGVYIIAPAPTQVAGGAQFTQSTDGSATTGSNTVSITGAVPAGSSAPITVQIPADTTITPVGSWNGVVSAPTVVSTPVSVPNGTTQGVTIEAGSATTELQFSQPVRLVIPNQAGQRVGFTEPGSSTFTEITAACGVDNETAVAAQFAVGSGDQACKIDSGNDLVIWTNHFTTFATFAATPSTTGTSSSSSSNSSSQSTATEASSESATSTAAPAGTSGVKGASVGTSSAATSNAASTAGSAKKAHHFLGLGWWWLPILVVVVAILGYSAFQYVNTTDVSGR